MTTTKLNQIVAVEKGTKGRVSERLTTIYKTIQKGELFIGHHKTYKPRDEDPTSQFGEPLPDDLKNVQQSVTKLLGAVAEAQTELFDISYTKDVTNCLAKADIAVDGTVLVKDAPVTFIIWLSNQLNDLHSEAKKLPTLDPGENWHYDPNRGCYATAPADTARTKKVSTALILHPPTKEHPAQVKEITEDVRAGTWSTVKFSAAIPFDRKETLLARVEKLQRAVKQAREAANMLDVAKTESVGKAIFDFVLAD